MIENPRPTRHLEHIEPARVGTPIPGSAQAWAVTPEGDPVPTDGPAADGDPGSPPANGAEAGPVPDQARSRVRAVVAGGVTLAVVALGIGGALALRGDRPNDVGDATPVVGVLDLPAIAIGDRPSDGATGAEDRVGEARTRLADAVEDGEATHAGAAARGATSSAVLRGLRQALDAGKAALELRPPVEESPESRTAHYVETLDARRSAILEAAADVADARHAAPGPATPWSPAGHGSDGTAATGPSRDQGGTGGGDAGTGGGEASGGGSEGGATGGTGSTGGGTTTPTATAPPPTARPTSEPSAEPSPGPSAEPTPDPSASATAAPEPTGP
ncbi:hypothetical protein ACFS27_19925 [Promicromonospora vindobonensis]|uniref:DUF5667 domain-containing protein n=1 Tax=Promicromonospora vindobonensis TaxID=195748 RepID=A0ABW5VX66_9MICO